MIEKNRLRAALDECENKRKEALKNEILKDFEARREERRQIELGWQMNLNFLLGNQYVAVSPQGIVEDTDRSYFWQEREVFNHLAPLIETRLAKLSRVRPVMKVLPFSASDEDIFTAKMSTSILKSAQNRLELDAIISNATMWSEVLGTSFYKVIWDKDAGNILKNGVKEGDAFVGVCPPFEVFPDSLSAQGIKQCRSIIHTRALPIKEIKEMYGEDIEAQNVDIFAILGKSAQGGLGYSTIVPTIGKVKRDDFSLVIERYSVPSKKHKNGRLEIVAGNKLVYEGDLPYENMYGGTRGLPFVRQVSIETPHCFYGTSVLDRCIPIQRAFNAVKNRKHEFINRLTMGVLAVEDGSVDTDDLESEGLPPGKVLVYRQGANMPSMMDTGRVPSELAYEEDRLLNEFTHISGVSEIMRNSAVPSSITSGVALQLLIEQDDTRLTITAEIVRNAIRQVSQQILRLYKQFALNKRLARIAGDKGIEVFYWSKNDLGGDDIAFVTENELNETPASKRNMVLELLRAGLLHDENGKLSNGMKAKIVDLLGFGLWEEAQDLNSLHIKRAADENVRLMSESLQPKAIDEHSIHIAEHTRYVLTSVEEGKERYYYEHIEAHKGLLRSESVKNEIAREIDKVEKAELEE